MSGPWWVQVDVYVEADTELEAINRVMDGVSGVSPGCIAVLNRAERHKQGVGWDGE